MNSTVRRTEIDDRFKKHGVFSWCELITTNVEEAKVFYTRLFGWDLTAMHMGTDYTLVKADDEKIGGIMAYRRKRKACRLHFPHPIPASS